MKRKEKDWANKSRQGILPASERAVYAGGGFLAYAGSGFLLALLFPIYNIELGVDPILIGAIIAVGKLWDAIADPVMGVISDNTRTRFGRRRPYLFLGSLLCAITLPLPWLVGAEWTENTKVIYMVLMLLLFMTADTIYSVPYWALGSELSPDYHERTRIVAWRTMVGVFAGMFFSAWAYRFSQFAIFDDVLQGAFWVSVFMGVMFVITGSGVAFGTRERYGRIAQTQEKVRLFKAIKDIATNRQAVILLAAFVLSGSGGQLIGHLGLYINIYYVFSGDKVTAATYLGIAGMIGSVCALLSVQPLSWVSGKLTKNRTMQLAFLISIFGATSTFLFYNQTLPWLQFISVAFIAIGNAGISLTVASMKADVLDYDELTHGLRREGAFGSAFGWINKGFSAMAAMLSGVVLVVIGFDQAIGMDQSDSTILWMRILYALLPVLFLTISLILMQWYKLTPRKMDQIRVELEIRRGAVSTD